MRLWFSPGQLCLLFMLELQIQEQHAKSSELIQELLGSLVYRRQIHGSQGLPYGVYTTEVKAIKDARAWLAKEKADETRARPNGEW